MKKTLAFILVLLSLGAAGPASAGTFFESARFIQYTDENTALEEVRNGNLDIYYGTIPPDRLKKQADVQAFDSAGGSYSILVNPAEAARFNPFAIKEVRFALNYMIDRDLIVNELMGGFGSPTASYYGPTDPEFLTVIKVLEQFNFRYNPALAEQMITESLKGAGAAKDGNTWMFGSEPIMITVFIRSDDPIRRSIGQLLSSELEGMGFTVNKDFGDLNKAFVTVYGSDPADLKWHLYTEGWGRSAFVRYDSVGLAQMYGPWFSNMPGFNDPTYWNYENGTLDSLTQKIYSGNYTSQQQRDELIRDAASLGISESVRIFLASKQDRYVAGRDISGIINDFGAGVPSRFTPINAAGDGGQLNVGVKQIYQGAWNPVMGLTDKYSRQIWNVISDPDLFKHPFTGKTIPVRADWTVQTAGPNGTMPFDDAVMWDPAAQEWVQATGTATSKVTFDYTFGGWHNGHPMDINDVLYSLYFLAEWGTQSGDDKTHDAEFTPRVEQTIQTIKGVNVIDRDTLEVYVDYWHFDPGEIASWAALWGSVPWEVTAAMEKMVLDGKASFSRSGATSKNISWLSLLIPNDAEQIKANLDGFAATGHTPGALDAADAQDRYQASSDWIAQNRHAVISNGPFYLESYSPESRTITIQSFSESYPLQAGRWSHFEDPKLPTITDVGIKKVMVQGARSEVVVTTENADAVIYFLTDSRGRMVATDTIYSADGRAVIGITPNDTEKLKIGAGSIKIFATSDAVLKPDYYESSFIIASAQAILDGPEPHEPVRESLSTHDASFAMLVIAMLVIAAVITLVVMRKRCAMPTAR